MSTPSQQNHNSALVVLTTLFFMMGFITCMNDILIPHLKEIFELTYVQAMLIQFCFFYRLCHHVDSDGASRR